MRLARDARDLACVDPPAALKRENPHALTGADKYAVRTAARDAQPVGLRSVQHGKGPALIDGEHALVGGDEQARGGREQIPSLITRAGDSGDSLEARVGRPLRARPSQPPGAQAVQTEVVADEHLARVCLDGRDAAHEPFRLAKPRVAREKVEPDNAVLERHPEPPLRVGREAHGEVALVHPDVFAIDSDQRAPLVDERDSAAECSDGVGVASTVP